MNPRRLRILVLACLALGACSKSPPVSESAPVSADPPRATSPQSDTLETSMGPLRITPIWHGTLSLEIGETMVVVDPWSKAPADRLPKADLILITDIHPDHLDTKAIAKVSQADTLVVAPRAALETLPSAEPLDNGARITKLGIGIEAIPMYNEKRGPEEGKLFHDKGRGNGYLLSFGDTRVYLSGDTECTPEMRALEDIDLAFVCMNLPYTMPPEEAAQCIQAFRPKVVIPFHYRGSDLSVLQAALKDEKGIEVRLRDFYAE